MVATLLAGLQALRGVSDSYDSHAAPCRCLHVSRYVHVDTVVVHPPRCQLMSGLLPGIWGHRAHNHQGKSAFGANLWGSEYYY